MAFDKAPNFLDEEGDAMALGIGLGHGFKRINPNAKKHKSTENNPYYYYPGFIVGYVIKVMCLVVLARYGLGA